MSKNILFFLCFFAFSVACAGQTKPAGGGAGRDLAVLRKWQAGERVSPGAVAAFGLDSCFAVRRIDDRTFARMWGKSYKKNCTVPRRDLRYVRVLHRTASGEIRLGELVCHKSIAADLVEIFRALYEAGYPIGRMVLVDDYGADDERSMTANNTSCFNFRRVSGSRKLSAHSRGLAIDINTRYNPYVKRRADGSLQVRPEAGRAYADRAKASAYKIKRGDLCHKLFTQHGFKWGGDWKSVKDYQHFEKTGGR